MNLVADFPIYFSAFLALLYFKSFISNNKAFKVFTIYLVIIAIVQLASKYITFNKLGANLFLSHYYFISQFVFLSIFYKILLKYKWILWMLFLVLIGLSFQYIKDPSMYFRYNSLGMASTQILIVFYAALYLYKSLTKNNGFLLINVGVFIYLLSSALIFSSGNLALDISFSKKSYEMLTSINIFLYFAFQVLIFIEWYRNYRVKKN